MGKQLKTNSRMANVEKVWTNQDPVIRTQAEGEPLGLAQTTSAILSNGSEMDRQMGSLDPSALGRDGGFPSSLGKAGPRARAHEVYGVRCSSCGLPSQVPRRRSRLQGKAWRLPGRPHAGDSRGTSGLRRSHRKHTISQRGKLTERRRARCGYRLLIPTEPGRPISWAF